MPSRDDLRLNIRPTAVPGVNSGGAAAAESVRGRLDQFKQLSVRQIRDQTINTARAKAELDASRAVSEGTGITTKPNSYKLADMVYADRAQQVYLTEQSKAIRTQAAAIEAQHEADPDTFNKTYAGYAEGILSAAPDHLRDFLARDLEAHRMGAAIRVTDRFQKQLDDRREAGVRGELSESIRLLGNTAYDAMRTGGDLDVVESQVEKTNALISMAQSGDTPLFTPAQEAALREDVRLEFARGVYLGGFNAAPDKEAYLTDFNAGRLIGPDLSVGERDAFSRRMNAEISSEKAAARSDAAVARAELAARQKMLRDQGDRARELLDGGRLPETKADREQIMGLAADLYASGQPKEAEDLLISMRTAGVARDIVTKPLVEAEAEVAEALERPFTNTPLDRFAIHAHKTARATLERHRAGLAGNDPTGYARSMGVAGNLPPLDLADPAGLRNSLSIRNQASEAQEAMYKQRFSPLTVAEATATAKMLEGLPAGDALPFLAVIDEQLGAKADMVFEQMDKKNPILGFAGGLVMDGRPEVAEMLLAGREALSAGIVTRPSLDEMNAAAEQMLGDAYTLPGTLEHRRRIQEAALAHYAARVIEQKDASGTVFQPDAYQESLEEVTGGLINWGPGWFGRARGTIEAPFPGATESDVTDWVRSLDAATIDLLGGVAGHPSDKVAELILDDGALVSAGSGRYMVRVGSGFLLDRKGNPFELVYGGR